MLSLLDLPETVWQDIGTWLGYGDVVRLAASCKRGYHLAHEISGNQLLDKGCVGIERVKHVRKAHRKAWPSLRFPLILHGHTDFAWRCAPISGNRLVSCSFDKSLLVFNTEDGDVLGKMEGHNDIVTSVTYLPSQNKIVSASQDKSIIVWDGETYKHLHTFQSAHEKTINMIISLERNANKIPVSTASPSCTTTSSTTCTTTTTSTTSAPFATTSTSSTSAQFTSDLECGLGIVASCSCDALVRIWDCVSFSLLFTLKGHSDTVECIAFLHDENILASAGDDFRIFIWKFTPNYSQQKHRPPSKRNDDSDSDRVPIQRLTVSSPTVNAKATEVTSLNSCVVLGSGKPAAVRVECTKQMDMDKFATSLAFVKTSFPHTYRAPKALRFVPPPHDQVSHFVLHCGTSHGSARTIDYKSGTVLFTQRLHSSAHMIDDATCLATKVHLITCSTDKTLRMWRLSHDGRYHNHGSLMLKNPIRTIAVLPDGRIAVCNFLNEITIISWCKIINAFAEKVEQ
eukprot:m.123483 g.123483  ORF g.123483 m.123483 type:complete len:513 (+) comp9411_c1_seq1:168-1706(+)